MLHLSRMCVGAALGIFVGAMQPVMLGLGSFNAVPVLTAEFALVGATMGYALSNYLAFRQRIIKRVQTQEKRDIV